MKTQNFYETKVNKSNHQNENIFNSNTQDVLNQIEENQIIP